MRQLNDHPTNPCHLRTSTGALDREAYVHYAQQLRREAMRDFLHALGHYAMLLWTNAALRIARLRRCRTQSC